MRRLLCAAGVALALALSGAGVAFAAPSAIVKCGPFEHSAGNVCVPNVHPIPGRSGLPRFIDHGNSIVIGNVTVDFNAFPSVEAFRAAAIYRNATADFRAACDEALQVKAFNLRHVAARFNDRFDGHFIVLDGGPRLDVCSFANFGDLETRQGAFRNRFDHLFGNDHDGRFRTLHNSCGTNVNTTVVNNGDCQTVITDVDNYRRSVDHWNDLTRRFNTADLVRAHRGELDSAWRDHLHWRDVFNTARPRVTTTCAAPTTINNITVEAAPVTYVVPASATTTVAAPAPESPAPASPAPSSGGQVSQVPTGSVDTGWVA